MPATRSSTRRVWLAKFKVQAAVRGFDSPAAYSVRRSALAGFAGGQVAGECCDGGFMVAAEVARELAGEASDLEPMVGGSTLGSSMHDAFARRLRGSGLARPAAFVRSSYTSLDF